MLKEITLDDTELIVQLRSEPEVYRYFLSPHRITVSEHIKWYTEHYLSDPDRIECTASALSAGTPPPLL